MFCPNCGKDCGDTGFCNVCDQALISLDGQEFQDITGLPIGRYKGLDGHIELGYCTVTIQKVALSRTLECTISYQDIADVIFHHASGSSNGYLAIREHNDHLPTVETELDASCDEKALVFSIEMDREFYEVFSCLKAFLNITEEEGKNTQKSEHLWMKSADSNSKKNCPKCKSRMVSAYQDGPHRHITRPRGGPLLLVLFRCAVYFYYALQKKQKRYICLDCRHQWTEW